MVGDVPVTGMHLLQGCTCYRDAPVAEMYLYRVKALQFTGTTSNDTWVVLQTTSMGLCICTHVVGGRVHCFRRWIFVTSAETTRSRSVQSRAVVMEA